MPELANAESSDATAKIQAEQPAGQVLADSPAGPVLTKGVSGSAYYFDGVNDYIEIPPIEGLGTEQTKMLWISLETWPLPHDVYLIDQDQGKQQGNNNWIELLDSDSNGVPNIRAGFDGGNLFDSNGNIEVGYWYHIAVVSTSAGDVYTYINGVFDSSHSGFSAGTQPEGILIGATSSDRRANFKGIIDEVAFFNRALSDDEIWQIYQNTGRLRGNEPGLVGYWSFDNDEGELVKDATPYGNHGTLGHEGGHSAPDSPPDVVLTEPAEPEPPADGECRPKLTEGASGYGYYFDGDGDYIEIPPIEGLGAEHTKMLWANPDASPRPNYVYLIDQDQVKR
ncbi:MAG: LamG domain-containing protein, partial [Planctomycetota bacterium]